MTNWEIRKTNCSRIENLKITLNFNGDSTIQLLEGFENGVISNVHIILKANNPKTLTGSIFGEIKNSTLYNVDVKIDQSFTYEGKGFIASTVTDSVFNHVGVYTEFKITLQTNGGIIVNKVDGNCQFYGLIVRINEMDVEILVSIGLLVGSSSGNTNISYSFVNIDKVTNTNFGFIGGFIYDNENNLIITNSFVKVKDFNSDSSSFGGFVYSLGSESNVVIKYCWSEYHFSEAGIDYFGGYFGQVSETSVAIVSNTYVRFYFNNGFTGNKRAFFVSEITNGKKLTLENDNSYLYINYANCSNNDNSIPYFLNQESVIMKGELLVYGNCGNFSPTHIIPQIIKKNDMNEVKDNLKNFESDNNVLYYNGMVYYSESGSFNDKYKVFEIVEITNFDLPLEDIPFENYKPLLFYPVNSIFHCFSWDMYYSINIQRNPTYTSEINVVYWSVGKCENKELIIPAYFDLPIKECFDSPYPASSETSVTVTFTDNKNISIPLILTIPKKIQPDTNAEWYNVMFSGNSDIVLTKNYTIDMAKYNPDDMISEYGNVYFKSLTGEGETIVITLLFDSTRSLRVFPILKTCEISHIYFYINVTSSDVVVEDSIIGEISNCKLYDVHIILSDDVKIKVSNNGILASSIVDSTLVHVGVEFNTIEMQYMDINTVSGLIASEIKGENRLYGVFAKGDKIIRKESNSVDIVHYVGGLFGSVVNETTISYSFVDINSEESSLTKSVNGLFFSRTLSPITIIKSYVLVRNNQVMNSQLQKLGSMIGESVDSVTIRDSWIDVNEVNIVADSDKLWYGGLIASMNSPLYLQNSHMTMNKINVNYNRNTSYIASSTNDSPIIISNSYLHVKDGDISITYNNNHLDVYGMLHVYFNNKTNLPSNHYNISNLNQDSIVQLKPLNNFYKYSESSSSLYYDEMIYFDGESVVDKNSLFGDVDMVFEDNKVKYSESTIHPVIVLSTSALTKKRSYKMETVLTFQSKPTYNGNEIVDFTFGTCKFNGVNLNEKLYINIKNCIDEENEKYYLSLTNPNLVLLNFTLIKPIPVPGNEKWYSLIYSGNDTIYLNESITIDMDRYNIYDMMNEDLLYFESMIGEGENTVITLHYNVSDNSQKQLTVFPITSLNHFHHLYFEIEVQKVNSYDGDANFVGGIFNSIESTELYDIHITFDGSVTVSSTDINEGGIVGTRISNSTLFHVGIIFDTITLSMTNYNYSMFASEVFYMNNLMGLFVKGNTINEIQDGSVSFFSSVMIGSIESPTVISDSFVDVNNVNIETIYTKLSMFCSIVNSNITIERSYSIVRNGYSISESRSYVSGMIGYSNQQVIIRDSWVEMKFVGNLPIISSAFILESRNISIISHCYITVTEPMGCSVIGKTDSALAIFNNTYINVVSDSSNKMLFLYCHNIDKGINDVSTKNIYGSIVISSDNLPSETDSLTNIVTPVNRVDILAKPYSYILGLYSVDSYLYSSYLPFYDGKKINESYSNFYSGDIMYDENDKVVYNDSNKNIIIETNIPRYAIYPESLESYYIQLIPHNSSINGITVAVESTNEGNCIDVKSQPFIVSNVLPYSQIDLPKTECALSDEALTVVEIVLTFKKENNVIQKESVKLSIINKDSSILYFDTVPEEVIEGSDFTMQLQMPIAQTLECKWNEINDGHAKLDTRSDPTLGYTPSSSANYYYTIENDGQSTPNLTFNCSGTFIYPLSTEVKEIESKIKINVTDKENNTINVELQYNDPPNKVTANITLTSKPYSPVTFKYECDENISCSETEFTLQDTTPKIITITQLNNSFNFIRFDIMMNLTTEDENYEVFSPYNLSVLLENVTLEHVYNYSVYDNIAFERNLTIYFNLSNDEPVDDVVINIVCPEKLICSENVIILNSTQTFANMTVSQVEIEEGVVVNENLDITINSDDHRFKRPTYKYPIVFHNYFSPEVVFEPPQLEFNPYNNKTLIYNVTVKGNPIYPINITIDKLDLFNLSTYFVSLNKENNFRSEIEVRNNKENEKWTTLLRHSVEQDPESVNLYEIETEADYNISNLEYDTSDAPKVVIVNVSDYEPVIYVDFDMPCYVNNKYAEEGDNCANLYKINDMFDGLKPECKWVNNQTFKITYLSIELYESLFTPKSNLTIKPNYIKKSLLGDKTTEGSYSLTYMTPMIESAEFIDGKTIDILFTKEYEDLEENTNCKLFDRYETILGIDGKCSKVNVTHMIIDLGENFTITKDDELKLKKNYIKRIPNPVVDIQMTGFGTYTVVKSSRLPLLNPKIINIKPKVLACEALNLTSVVTYRSDKSHPVNYQWNVSNIDTNDQSFSSDSSEWIIPPYYLNNDTNYNVKLSVDSFLHDVESVNSSVFYSKEDFILMELEESELESEAKYFRSKVYRIYANVELKTCKDTVAPITVEWKVVNSNNKEIDRDTFSYFDDNKVLQINAHSLAIGKYQIICNVTADEIKESKTIDIEVVYSSLQVTIDKNYYQLYNYSDDINITATVVDEDSLSDAVFNYEWRFGSDHYFNTEKSNLFSSVERNVTLEEGTYPSSVTVKDTKYGRTATYEFTIKVEYLMFYVNIISTPANKLTFAPTDIFKLTAYITPEDIDTTDMIYAWSFANDSIVSPIISKNDTQTIYVSCENITSTEAQYLTLTITDGEYDITVFYKFYVVDKSISIGVVGSSTDYVFPEEYTITAGDWRAINMKYRFAVLIDDEIQYLQSDFSESQEYKGILPVGSVSDRFKLYLVVFIKDEFGSITKSVSDLPISSRGFFSDELKSNYTNGNSNDSYYVKVSTLSTLLNTVCEEDSNTCLNGGKCVNGYCNCTEEYYGEVCQNHIPIDGKTRQKSKTHYSNETGCIMSTYNICVNESQYGGKACDVGVDVKPADISLCNTEISTNGVWSNWTEWSKCSGYCRVYNGDSVRGVQARYRECLSTGSNVTCEGDIAEYQNCTVVCISPPKLCPGQYITEGTGTVIGLECSGHGKCLRTSDECGESDPNCHSICQCNSGYNGSACQYTTERYNSLLEFKSNIVKSMNETIYQEPGIGRFELQSKALNSLLTYPTNIHEDDVKTTNDLLFHVISEVERIVNNNNNNENTQNEIPSDLIVNVVKTTSLIMDNEWNQHLLYVTDDSNADSNTTQAPTVSPVPQYGKYYPELFKQIGIMYSKSLYAPPLTVTSPAMSVEFIKADESYIIDPERYVGDSTVYISSEKIRENKDSTIIITSWLDNPDSSEIIPDRNSNYLTVEVYSPNSRVSKASSNSIPSVVYILQRLTKGADLRHIQCTPTNDTLNGAMKLVVVGIISNDGGSRYLVCAGTQIQNKFTSNRKDIEPKVNEIGELQEAALKIDFKGDYTFVLIVTCVILFIGVILIFAYKCYDYKEFERLEEWQSFSFMRFGYFVDNEDWETGREKDFTDQFIFNIRNHHSWLSPSCTTVKELTIVNRHQRVIVLLCEVLTSCAVNAGLYATSDRNAGQLAFTMIASSLAMLPATIILPYLYKYANNYSSATVRRKLRGIVTWWKKLKGFFRRHAKSTLFYLQAGLITTDLAYDVLNAIFFIAFLCLLPSGYFSIVFAFLFVVFLLETSSLFVVVSEQKKCQISSLIIFNILLLLVYIIAIVIYCVLWNDTTTATYSIWKTWTSTPGFDELLKYAEVNLECCGYNTISDYNMTDCTTPFIVAQGGFPSCRTRLHGTLNDWAGLYITYFVIAAVVLLLKIVLLFAYISFKIEIVLPDLDATAESAIKPGDETNNNATITTAGNTTLTTTNYSDADPDGSVTLKIVLALRKSINLVRTKRKKEYIEWRRSRKMRAFLVVLANFFMFCYVVIMTFVTLLYGLTYTKEQSQYWAISLLGSVLIAILIQEPTTVLVETAAEKGLTALDRD